MEEVKDVDHCKNQETINFVSLPRHANLEWK